MTGNRRLGQPKTAVNVTHAHLAIAEKGKNPQPCLVSQGAEDLGKIASPFEPWKGLRAAAGRD